MEEAQPRQLERGELSFFYRPRSDEMAGGSQHFPGVQRLLIALCPERKRQYRVLAIAGEDTSRFWGFVDLVLDSPQDLRAALSAQTYAIDTELVGYFPAAERIASGRYQFVEQDGETWFDYQLSDLEDGSIIERNGSYAVRVANPDPWVWGLAKAPSMQAELYEEAEVHVTLPATLPTELLAELGNQQTIFMTNPGFLDFPGVELIFIAR